MLVVDFMLLKRALRIHRKCSLWEDDIPYRQLGDERFDGGRLLFNYFETVYFVDNKKLIFSLPLSPPPPFGVFDNGSAI